MRREIVHQSIAIAPWDRLERTLAENKNNMHWSRVESLSELEQKRKRSWNQPNLDLVRTNSCIGWRSNLWAPEARLKALAVAARMTAASAQKVMI